MSMWDLIFSWVIIFACWVARKIHQNHNSLWEISGTLRESAGSALTEENKYVTKDACRHYPLFRTAPPTNDTTKVRKWAKVLVIVLLTQVRQNRMWICLSEIDFTVIWFCSFGFRRPLPLTLYISQGQWSSKKDHFKLMAGFWKCMSLVTLARLCRCLTQNLQLPN